MNILSEKNIFDCQYRNQCFLCIVKIQPNIRQKTFFIKYGFYSEPFVFLFWSPKLTFKQRKKVSIEWNFKTFFSFILGKIYIRITFFKTKKHNRISYFLWDTNYNWLEI